MLGRKSYRRFAVVLAIGLTASGAASSTFAQSGGVVPGSQEHVQSLLDQYAPGVKLNTLNLPKNAFRASGDAAVPSGFGIASSGINVPVVGAGTVGANPAAAAAARAKAQTFLNRYAPGITLGEQGGVRVEVPGAPVVDTRSGVMPAVEMSKETLHRLAIDESLRALRDEDFARASRWVTAVAADRPQDGDVRQLESLALLGEGRIYEAAEAAKAGLKHAPAWDRSRLRNVLPRHDDLFQSLRKQVEQNSEDGMTVFLLAYHELMLGQSDEAARLLEIASRHLPEGWLTASVRARFENE